MGCFCYNLKVLGRSKMKRVIGIMACVGLLFVSTATADLLCVKNSQTAKKNKVNFSGAFKVVAGDSCGSGFTALLDTSVFKGDKGDTGATGATGTAGAAGTKGASAVSSASCTRRQAEVITVYSSSSYNFSGISTSCNSGEYAHVAVLTRTNSFSSSYSDERTGGSLASTTTVAEDLLELNLLENDLFLVGYSLDDEGYGETPYGGGRGGSYFILSGTETETFHVDLTCCQRDD